MSKIPRGSACDLRAVSSYDELVVLGIVIILFSAGIALNVQLYGACQRNFELNELYNKADEISDRLRTHERLIYQGQVGIFEVSKIVELEDSDLNILVSIPDDCGLIVTIRDISVSEGPALLTLNYDNRRQADENKAGRVIIDLPVNLRMNELEVHAGKLTVTL